MVGRHVYQTRREAGTEPAKQVERALLLVFGRNPCALEGKAPEGLVQAQGLPVFCRALYNTNEFVYLE
jgi:hypothetical protein